MRGKLKNYRHTLLRRERECSEIDLQAHISQLEQAIAPIDKTTSINSLRGLEGAGSAAYFGCFDKLIKGSEFEFKTRNRRSPTDPVNALLSLG